MIGLPIHRGRERATTDCANRPAITGVAAVAEGQSRSETDPISIIVKSTELACQADFFEKSGFGKTKQFGELHRKGKPIERASGRVSARMRILEAKTLFAGPRPLAWLFDFPAVFLR
jgi:hypothetical protein